MAAIRKTRSPMAENGLYIVAATNGPVRALVNPEIAGAMPRLHEAIDRIGRILQRCLVEEDLTVWVKFERGPRWR